MYIPHMPLCATKSFATTGCGATARSAAALSLVLAAALGAALPAAAAAQVIPPRPSGVTDQQIQGVIQQRGLGDQLRQRLQQSGLTPDQVRARLRSAGYSENLVDAYLTPATPGEAAPTPTLEVLRAASVLGMAEFALSDTALATRDSIVLTRADSFLLDTLNLVIGQDSIPTRRDSLGVLRVDTARVAEYAARVRRPRVFGLDVFRRVSNQFAPVASGPVDSEYRLGAGDEVVLILTGEVELAQALPVTREGFVVIPQVGQIFVANLTLGQFRELLYSRLARVYAGIRRGPGATTQFDVTVSRLRVIQVFVNGEVVRPGAYGVSSVGTILNALYQAGGPTERGNFRGVRVVRGGRTVGTLDLYDYLLAGNARDDIRLEQGDVLFVPPRERRVSVEGRVLRPAIYDLAAGEGLRELLQMAGGLLAGASTERAQVERILPPSQRRAGGRDRTVIDVDLASVMGERPAQRFELEPDDRVTVFGVTQPVRNRLTLRGNVWQPGTYQLEAGMTLSSLIAAAGGLKPDTYVERAHVLRLLPDSTRRLVPVSLAGMHPLGAPGAAGRPDEEGGRPANDIALQEFDEVTIYSSTGFRPERQIAVFGSVRQPGVYPFRDSMTLKDALILAGGLRDDAYLLEAEISRIPETRETPNELARIMRVPLDSSYVLDPTAVLRRETSARGEEPHLQPYDNVFVRMAPGFEFQRNVVLSGEVLFPGRYSLLRRDERVADVIRRAGGLTPDAYVGGARLYRIEGRAGRIGIDLERVLRDPSFRDNLILFAGDSLHIPQYQSVVRVDGSVNSPVAVAFVPGRDTDYYVDRAGGFARRADRRRTYVIQPNGAVDRRGARVQPGARVYVPEVPADEQRTNWLQVLGTWTSVLTSALTTILVIKRL